MLHSELRRPNGATIKTELGFNMNKNFLFATASLIAVSLAAPAMAADLAAAPYTKAPPPVVSPMYNWSGFYIGLNAGGGVSRWGTSVDVLDVSVNATGGTVGGQVGYRWQAANWVFGLEGQGNWADFTRSRSGTVYGYDGTASIKANAFGLITGQVGYAFNNVLLYVKGGAAVVSNKASASATEIATGDQFGGSISETRWGGTVGAGLEVGFAPNWSVGVEYNHIFISHDYGVDDFSVNLKQDIDMGLVRLNYKF